MKQTFVKAAVLACCMAAVGCKQAPMTMGPGEYAVMTIATTDREIPSNYSATIRGRQDIAIYPQVSGTISQLCVNEGQKVAKGQTLFIIDQVPYVGALVSASISQPLTTVSDNSEMYVYFSMTENQLLALTRQYGSIAETLKSMPGVQLQLSDGSTYDQTGRVESISGVIDTSTGSVSLRAAFPNPNGLLHSGGAGNIILPSIYKDCIAVPQAATFELQNKVYVYKVMDGKASSAMIDVEKISNGREYIARAGLVPGDVIVAEGVGLLREGTPIVPKGQAAAAAAAAPATDESAAQTQTEKEE